MKCKLLLLFAFLLSAKFVSAQANFFATDTIQEIEITFSQPNWDYQLDTMKAGTDGYLLATQLIINGTVFDSVGVRYKGNSSYDSTRTKNPFHIKIDFVHGNADYNGITDVKLSNCYQDPTYVREVLAYKILRNYMAAPQCNFVRLIINGTYYGVYSNSESIDDDFLATHFYSSDNSFFKCNPAIVTNGHIPNLTYLGTDSSNYYDRYEIKSTYAWKDLIDLCDTIGNFSTHMDSVLDVDRAIWMLAYNNETVNLDSYSGAFAQNYYLYKDGTGRFDPIIWDLNMCFGGFTNTGLSNLSIAGMQSMTPLLHSTDASRPLLMKVLSDASWQKMYIAHMRTINSEFFSNANYLAEAQAMQTLIDSSVQAEIFPLFTYTQFQQSITTNTGTIPGLSVLMDARATYLGSTSQFQQTPPAITAVVSSPLAPALSDSIWITANVTNGSSVWLGARAHVYDVFKRQVMFDDGLHNDGAAGDNTYGMFIIATAASMQYYIYSENANAGMFSPERAEYEFYTVQVATTTASVGELVINEFMAANQNDAINEAGENEDWIELYNRTGVPLSLDGLYLTDDYATPMKYPFPDLVIQPYSYLIIWADQGSNTSSYLHCNFKLSAAGEELMLSNASGVVLDSLTFGVQNADVSYGRCPNGTGAFMYYAAPTFNAGNICPAGIQEAAIIYSAHAFPNPANENVTIFSNNPAVSYADLVNVNGQQLIQVNFENDKANFDLRELESGIYFFRSLDKNGSVLESGKIIVTH
jgi:spore coat protein CotH